MNHNGVFDFSASAANCSAYIATVDVDYWNTIVNRHSTFMTAVSTSLSLMLICLFFSVISSTPITRATVPSFEFRRTYIAVENQVIALLCMCMLVQYAVLEANAKVSGRGQNLHPRLSQTPKLVLSAYQRWKGQLTCILHGKCTCAQD